MKNTESSFDLLGRQRRYELEAEAVDKYIQMADHIRDMGEQLRSQTDQLKQHNDQFRRLNDELKREADERESGDRAEHRFTIISVVVGCALTFLLDHLGDMFAFVKSLMP